MAVKKFLTLMLDFALGFQPVADPKEDWIRDKEIEATFHHGCGCLIIMLALLATMTAIFVPR